MSQTAPARARRSVLYMPASNARAMEKARDLACDVVILDLEDAVAPDQKDLARDQACAAVAAGGFGKRELVVRVNGLDTPWGEKDLKAVAAAAPDAVLVPKVARAEDVASYHVALHAAPERTRLWAMIETARSLFHLEEIADSAASTRLSAWVMGTNDLAKETGAQIRPGRAAFLGTLGLAVAAGKMAGLTVLDGVFNGLEDDAGLEAECRQALEFGFDGKTLIHPRQIEIANRVFSPSPEDVAFARAVIAAFAAPENAGKGALRVEGKMAERLHLAGAEKVVAVAQAIGG
jgi:citrate lyase subunit beta/citryl-CoA lyase